LLHKFPRSVSIGIRSKIKLQQSKEEHNYEYVSVVSKGIPYHRFKNEIGNEGNTNGATNSHNCVNVKNIYPKADATHTNTSSYEMVGFDPDVDNEYGLLENAFSTVESVESKKQRVSYNISCCCSAPKGQSL